jgi:DNA processing protein
MNDDLPYWLGLVRFRPFGAMRLAKLRNAFPSMREAFFASAPELLRAGIPKETTELFVASRSGIQPEKELEELTRSGVKAVTILDPSYPPRLKTIHDPPAVLFLRGEFPDSARPHLAVVGSRKATPYGAFATRTLVEPLAAAGAVIVSGLAYGIDALAHAACLEAGGTTLAVLAGGLDHIYPSQNRALAERILKTGGALLSEFPLGVSSLKQHFPFRNRIIAGLSDGTLVVEAAERSGSLITAQSALEAGRDVYAVPGPIDSPVSAGPNNLLKMGATPATHASDILPVAEPETKPVPVFTTEEERRIFACLNPREACHMDELSVRLSLPAEHLNRLMTLMEMNGAIRHTGGGYYIRA